MNVKRSSLAQGAILYLAAWASLLVFSAVPALPAQAQTQE